MYVFKAWQVTVPHVDAEYFSQGSRTLDSDVLIIFPIQRQINEKINQYLQSATFLIWQVK